MTLASLRDTLTWALPAVQCLGSIAIVRRMPFKFHPALHVFLIAGCYIESLTQLGWLSRDYAILIQAVTMAWLVAESAHVSRFSRGRLAIIAGLAISACAFWAGSRGWTLDREVSLFRGDYRLVMALLADFVAIYRWREPVLECRRHKIYRIGVAAWLSVLAVAGSFVKGGIGMALLTYTPYRWLVIDVAVYMALVLVISVMAAAMVLTYTPRKAAAKTGDAWLKKSNVVTFRRVA